MRAKGRAALVSMAKDMANTYQITQFKKKLVHQFKTTVRLGEINDSFSCAIMCLFFTARILLQKAMETGNQ